MQVLYQLSYGPFGYAKGGWNAGRSALADGLAWRGEILHGGGAHTWRHTATSLPCTVTCSAGSSIGA